MLPGCFLINKSNPVAIKLVEKEPAAIQTYIWHRDRMRSLAAEMDMAFGDMLACLENGQVTAQMLMSQPKLDSLLENLEELKNAIDAFEVYADFLEAPAPRTVPKQQLYKYLWKDFDSAKDKIDNYNDYREQYSTWQTQYATLRAQAQATAPPAAAGP